tara:strand:- start:5063 stop:6244 length:1182 start_codon:yes stop_codon:yes gene_type:complete
MKLIEKDLSKVEGKNILVRLDLNVPLNNSIIEDTSRADKILDTLKFLSNKKSNLILISHIGRPKGRRINNLSLKPVANYLEKKLNIKVNLVENDIFSLKKENLFKNKNDEIIMLENIRYYENEEKNDKDFAKKIASLGDIYVNEAFSCSHRCHASVSEITNYIPSFGGILLNKEVTALNKITKEILKPVTCIIGGAKISTKIQVIKNLIPKFDNIIIVGGMANNIIKFKGHEIGKSINEHGCEKIIDQIFSLAEKNNCKIFYPEDFLTGKSLDDISNYKKINQVENDEMILDIGTSSIGKIKKLINNSKTILWNGPAGYFENPNFSKGSYEIAKTIAERTSEKKLYSVLGGGDTISLINKLNLFDKYNFVSTAGGAFLEYLEGKELPGIKALS